MSTLRDNLGKNENKRAEGVIFARSLVRDGTTGTLNQTKMNLSQIKSAVEAGKVVCWGNTSYKVIKDGIGQWLVRCDLNGYCFGLTRADGGTLQGQEHECFVLGGAA